MLCDFQREGCSTSRTLRISVSERTDWGRDVAASVLYCAHLRRRVALGRTRRDIRECKGRQRDHVYRRSSADLSAARRRGSRGGDGTLELADAELPDVWRDRFPHPHHRIVRFTR